MICFWMALALAAPPDWEEVVERATSLVDARWTPEEAAPIWEAQCASGQEAACAMARGVAPAEALAAACRLGDGVACLGEAWSREPREPEAAVAIYQEQCDAGLPRACAEVARAHADGIGVYSSRRTARRMAEPLCASGVGAACVVLGKLDAANRPARSRAAFEEALANGMRGADLELLKTVPEAVRVERYGGACAVGLAEPCVQLAEIIWVDDPDRARGLIARSCDLGSVAGCVRQVLYARDTNTISRADAEQTLHLLCEVSEEACVHEAFLHYGGDSTTFFPGTYLETENQRILGQVVPFARECLRDMRDRHPDYGSEVELQLQVWLDERGVVRGVDPRSDADEEYRMCVARHTLGIETIEPVDGRARVSMDMTLGLEASIDVSTFKRAEGSEAVAALEQLAWEEWGAPANACYMDYGGSAWDRVFTWVYGEILRDGSFVGTRLVESSGSDETDACILDLMQGVKLESEYRYKVKVRIQVVFNIGYRAPRSRGEGFGEAADPDTYMYGGGVPPPLPD